MVHTRSSSRRIPDPLLAGHFPQSLPTPALYRHDTAVVWDLRLHGEPGGPASITGTARFVVPIFYIVITSLKDTRPGSVSVAVSVAVSCRAGSEPHYLRPNRRNRPASSSVSIAVSVPVRSGVNRSVHNRAMIRLRSTHSDRLTSVSSRTTRHRTTPSRVPTAGVETTDKAWVLLPEAPNPQPTRGR